MRLCSVILFLFASFSVVANKPVNDSVPQVELGAFGGFGFGYSEVSSNESLEINLQGGVILNHWLAGGIGVNTFFSISPLKDNQTNQDATLLGVYGGLFVSPIIYSNALVHVTVPIFGGYGGISYELYDLVDAATRIEDSDQYWVFEPGIEVEMNLLRFLRLAVGGYYRCSSKIHLTYENGGDPILPGKVLNGFSFGLKLRFGKF